MSKPESPSELFAAAVGAAKEALRIAYQEERVALADAEARVRQRGAQAIAEWEAASATHAEAVATRVRVEGDYRDTLRLLERIGS